MKRQIKISAACKMILDVNARGGIAGPIKPEGDGFVIEVSQGIFDHFLAERMNKEDFSNWFARLSAPSTVKRPLAMLQAKLLDMDEDEKQSDLGCDNCGGPLPERYFEVVDNCLPDPCPPEWYGESWMACSQGCVDAIMAKYNGK
jgi:hypothetical protein